MAIHDLSAQRLYVEVPLEAGAEIACTKDQAHYLLNVLRVSDGADLNVFNGQHGEWRAHLARIGKRDCSLHIGEQIRSQDNGPDVQLLFAPLKRARLDYMVQKAAELGVAQLAPVMTQHTVPDRVNLERMRANAIEAAEQCGILYIPQIIAPAPLKDVLDGWDDSRALVFCDEGAACADPIAGLSKLERGAPLAALIGPEGGFSEEERTHLNALAFVHAISLGPRIMRADTAATAVLTLLNAVLGDWR